MKAKITLTAQEVSDAIDLYLALKKGYKRVSTTLLWRNNSNRERVTLEVEHDSCISQLFRENIDRVLDNI